MLSGVKQLNMPRLLLKLTVHEVKFETRAGIRRTGKIGVKLESEMLIGAEGR